MSTIIPDGKPDSPDALPSQISDGNESTCVSDRPPQNINFDQAELTGAMLHRAREIFAYGGLDGVMNRPLMHESGLYPQFASKAQGYELTDSNGKVFVDWINGWGSILLGHRNEEVRQAIVEQVDVATSIALMHPIEIDVAELLIELVPCAEMVAFGKNGSDSLTAAIRIARAATGREMIFHCGFHGFHDWYTCLNPKAQGILPILRDYVTPFPYNDLETLKSMFASHEGQVAAIVMEPVNMFIPDQGYLQAVKELAHKHGAVLLWDEVVTAFRLGRGGAQEYFGVEPDIAVLGKGMGNGMPLSAVVGKRELMKHLPRTAYGMTYRGETISLAAANACLNFIKTHDVAGRLEATGSQLRLRFHELAQKYSVECELSGPSARMTFVFNDQGALNWEQLRSMFVLHCLKNGVLTNGNVMVSYSHDEEAIARTLTVFESGLQNLSEAIHASSAESTTGSEFAYDAGAIIIQGCIDSVERSNDSRTIAGWSLVDGVVVDRLYIEMEDGRRFESQVNPKQAIADAFPHIPNAEYSGFKIVIPHDADAGPERRFRIVAKIGNIERFHCLVVDDAAAGSPPKQGPYWFRDGVLYL